MHGARVGDEVLSRPRIAREELGRQQVSLQAIAARAGEDDVARRVSAAVRQRMHVVERREVEFEWRAAVHAAPAAVAHRGSFDRSLLWAGGDCFCPAADARRAWEGDTVELPTSGQCHLAKKATPRRGKCPVAGCRADQMKRRLLRRPSMRRAAIVVAAFDMLLDVGRVGSLASGGTRDDVLARAPYKCNACIIAQEANRHTRHGLHLPVSEYGSYRNSPCAPSCASPVQCGETPHSPRRPSARDTAAHCRADSSNTGTRNDRSWRRHVIPCTAEPRPTRRCAWGREGRR